MPIVMNFEMIIWNNICFMGIGQAKNFSAHPHNIISFSFKLEIDTFLISDQNCLQIYHLANTHKILCQQKFWIIIFIKKNK